jgi:hypothetical protein
MIVKRRITERPIRVTTIDAEKTPLRDFLDDDGKVLKFDTIRNDSRMLLGGETEIHFTLLPC